MVEATDDAAEKYRDMADALDVLADDLSEADSIAEDVPVLSELFHEVRTSGRSGRDGRHVALFDYDHETEAWSCRSVAFLETGTHYRDTGADLTLSFKPFAFLSVERFREHLTGEIRRDARAARQNAAEVERKIEDRERFAEGGR